MAVMALYSLAWSLSGGPTPPWPFVAVAAGAVGEVQRVAALHVGHELLSAVCAMRPVDAQRGDAQVVEPVDAG